jgi:hypothetical protein
MNLIQGITDKPKQQTTIPLADGSGVSLLLEYRPNQRGWFYDLAWSGFELDGMRLVTSPRLLRAFRHLLPFDIAVLATANVDPLNQTDFADGTCFLYLLQGDDLDQIESEIYTGD